MGFELHKLNGLCSCGRTHKLNVQEILIGSGSLAGFDEVRAKLGIKGRLCAVYDENTYDAEGLRRPSVESEIVLPAEGLHANETGVEALESRLGDAGCLVAVGSGTVHDIVRYTAAKRKIPFISVPTAASVDGFVSTVAAMTWNGFKITFPAVSPVAVVADLNVLKSAPERLTRSGVGDMLGKYISLADWKIGSLLTGEYYCEQVASMEYEALKNVTDSCGLLLKKDPTAIEKLIEGLLLSGLAMQMIGNSRPASGAEHHLSHLWEMAVINAPTGALHGEKVGVGTLAALKCYQSYSSMADVSSMIKPYAVLTKQYAEENFGILAEEILKENAKDCMQAVTQESLARKWALVREVLASLPDYNQLRGIMQDVGAKCSLEEIDLDKSILPKSEELSPFVRNRLTFMRLRKML